MFLCLYLQRNNKKAALFSFSLFFFSFFGYSWIRFKGVKTKFKDERALDLSFSNFDSGFWLWLLTLSMTVSF